jgi:hypothetical protein
MTTEQMREVDEVIRRLSQLRSDAGPTVESVYGRPLAELRAPRGWRLTGWFALPKQGEYYLSRNGVHWMHARHAEGPRLLLARAQRLVFDVVDRDRKAKPGEWYMKQYRQPHEAPKGTDTEVEVILSFPHMEDVPEEAQ